MELVTWHILSLLMELMNSLCKIGQNVLIPAKIYVTALEKGPENDLDIAVLYPASETHPCCLDD